MEVTEILLNAQSPDANVRRVAEESLKQFQEQNFPIFLLSLARELANNDKPVGGRMLAGLVLKNSLDARESFRKTELAQRWIALETPAKTEIKLALLSTLGTPTPDARHTAAQVIAKVAGIELERQEWPDLVPALKRNMDTQGPEHSGLKQATMQTLGFVCEEVVYTKAMSQEQVNQILTAVVQGMNAPDNDNDVRLAATNALQNALEFARTNFENDMERSYIMRVICQTTQNADVRIRQAAMECLVSISSLYYDKLAPYIQDIFQLTAKAAREDQEPVALQAIELWSTICDEEIDIQEGDYEGADSDMVNHKFIEKALPVLVPLLLETLTKQAEDQDFDEDVWNLAMSGGTCLGLVARTVGNAIVAPVMPFVDENIGKTEWRSREAAIYAFGSILEGPSLEKIMPLVNLGFQYLLNSLNDQNAHVRDTTAWTLGRIFEFQHGANLQMHVVTSENLPVIMTALVESMKRDQLHVAEKVCGAVYFLAHGYEDWTEDTSPLSPYMPLLIETLLLTADREDASEARLKAAAYETLNEVIRCSTTDSQTLIVQLVPIMIQKLEATLQMQNFKEKQTELQALLCGVLQVIIQKLASTEQGKYGVLQQADQMMTLFLRVFACRSATVHEEAMLAIGALAYAAGVEFGKYMGEFAHYLVIGLENFEEYQVCAVTVGVVGDICRALDDKVLPYCDSIMTQLLTALSSNHLHRSVKPAIFSCFGDIALAIGENFEKYLIYAMQMLQGATKLSFQQQGTDDEELAEYNNQLRCGIFEAYSGIFQGFKNSKPEVMLPFAEHILSFIDVVSQDPNRDEVVTKVAVGVMGDLADTLTASVAPLFAAHPFYKNFIKDCLASDDDQVKETAEWAQGVISRIVPP